MIGSKIVPSHHEGPILYSRLVAKRLLHQNTEYCDLVAEKARSGPDITVDLAIECGQSRADSRYPSKDVGEVPPDISGGPDTTRRNSTRESHSATPIPRSSPFPDQDLGSSATGSSSSNFMTLNRLRRLNHMMEYMETHKLVNGLSEITKVPYILD